MAPCANTNVPQIAAGRGRAMSELTEIAGLCLADIAGVNVDDLIGQMTVSEMDRAYQWLEDNGYTTFEAWEDAPSGDWFVTDKGHDWVKAHYPEWGNDIAANARLVERFMTDRDRE